LEADLTGNFAYPTPLPWDKGVVKVAYSVWGQGLRIATVVVPELKDTKDLPPVEEPPPNAQYIGKGHA
jgi:hypothetical protein